MRFLQMSGQLPRPDFNESEIGELLWRRVAQSAVISAITSWLKKFADAGATNTDSNSLAKLRRSRILPGMRLRLAIVESW
jgi:hypothetical protein